jgi:hypothetical protein
MEARRHLAVRDDGPSLADDDRLAQCRQWDGGQSISWAAIQ